MAELSKREFLQQYALKESNHATTIYDACAIWRQIEEECKDECV